MRTHIVELYTDGSCLGNPGIGGWGVYCKNDGRKLSGSLPQTTNNIAELTAVIEALKYFGSPRNKFIIITDSQYVINIATGVNEAKANLDLWDQYKKALKGRDIEFKWVEGHTGDQGNEIANSLAQTAAKVAQAAIQNSVPFVDLDAIFQSTKKNPIDTTAIWINGKKPRNANAPEYLVHCDILIAYSEEKKEYYRAWFLVRTSTGTEEGILKVITNKISYMLVQVTAGAENEIKSQKMVRAFRCNTFKDNWYCELTNNETNIDEPIQSETKINKTIQEEKKMAKKKFGVMLLNTTANKDYIAQAITNIKALIKDNDCAVFVPAHLEHTFDVINAMRDHFDDIRILAPSKKDLKDIVNAAKSAGIRAKDIGINFANIQPGDVRSALIWLSEIVDIRFVFGDGERLGTKLPKQRLIGKVVTEQPSEPEEDISPEASEIFVEAPEERDCIDKEKFLTKMTNRDKGLKAVSHFLKVVGKDVYDLQDFIFELAGTSKIRTAKLDKDNKLHMGLIYRGRNATLVLDKDFNKEVKYI